MNSFADYIEKNKDNALNELIDFLKIPSVSSLSEHKADVDKCADWVVEALKKAGVSVARKIETKGHPIVYGEWLEAGADKPTVLVYGHYDVQPVDPLNEWNTKPFEPAVVDGWIYGRGTCDDKGQLFTHIKAVEAHLKTAGKLPVNVKFLIEGEEEAGSSNLDEFIENNAELLKCDTVVISDTEWFEDGLPSICYSLRGITYFEVTVKGPFQDLHSGTYGGGIDNPVNVLCWMMAQMRDKYGRVTIPGFYDEVLALTKDERAGFALLPYDEDKYCSDLGVSSVYGEHGYTTLERTWARPSFDINGIFGGFTGEGAKTILPAQATVKFSMRLVPNQNYEDIIRKTEDYILKLAPPTVKVEFKALHGGNPVLVPRDSAGVKAAMKALKEAFGKDSVFMRDGGSIPVVNVFSTVLNAPVVLMGLGLPGDNIHGPNEHFRLENFFGGIKASAIFLNEIAK